MMRVVLIAVLLLAACSGASPRPADSEAEVAPARTLPVRAHPAPPSDVKREVGRGVTVLTGGRVMTATGAVHDPGFVVLRDGLIESVGAGAAPEVEGARRVDTTGKVVTPGLIDTHSHLGVYPMPSVKPHADGNEMTGRTTPQVWAEHGFWPQDPGIWRAVAGGVTTIQVLPGSANLIGGRSFTAKLRPGVSAREMRFPGAPQGLKIACGENPKAVYGERGGPATRMGNTAYFRAAFQSALEYQRTLQRYERDLEVWEERQGRREQGETTEKSKGEKKPDDPPELPKRDLGAETLVGVLEGRVLVHNHCYRADDMAKQLDLAEEFGFRIRSFHHALEAYKLRERLAEEDVSVSSWSDWWGFKMEAFDGVPQNLAMVAAAGARAIVHSDSASELRRLNQEAAKAATAGRKVGLETDPSEVLRWITSNPAWALGVEELTGSLEPGKMADVVVWNGDPFSVYTLAEQVYIDGILVFDRTQKGLRPTSDFEVGLVPPEASP